MPKNWKQTLWYIFIAVFSGSGVYFLDKLPYPKTKADIVNGTWYLIRQDADKPENSKEIQRVQTIWTGEFNSRNGILTGELTSQSKTALGITNQISIEGVLSGILRAELLSISYGSRKIEGPGAGAWLLKRKRDGHQTFIGQAIGHDCTTGLITRCPAILTQDTDFALKKYNSELSQMCVVIPMSKIQSDALQEPGKKMEDAIQSSCS